MSYSNRPSKWADPTVAPVFIDPVTKKLRPPNAEEERG